MEFTILTDNAIHTFASYASRKEKTKSAEERNDVGVNAKGKRQYLGTGHIRCDYLIVAHVSKCSHLMTFILRYGRIRTDLWTD